VAAKRMVSLATRQASRQSGLVTSGIPMPMKARHTAMRMPVATAALRQPGGSGFLAKAAIV
jgi:hypothetical protein